MLECKFFFGRLNSWPANHRPFFVSPLYDRYFSISSSPLAHPNRIHITVAVVRYKTYLAEPRFGVCSTFLEALQPDQGAKGGGGGGGGATEVMVWLRKGCLMPRGIDTWAEADGGWSEA